MLVTLIDKSGLKISFAEKLMEVYGGFSLLGHLFEELNLQSEIEEMLPCHPKKSLKAWIRNGWQNAIVIS